MQYGRYGQAAQTYIMVYPYALLFYACSNSLAKAILFEERQIQLLTSNQIYDFTKDILALDSHNKDSVLPNNIRKETNFSPFLNVQRTLQFNSWGVKLTLVKMCSSTMIAPLLARVRL